MIFVTENFYAFFSVIYIEATMDVLNETGAEAAALAAIVVSLVVVVAGCKFG